MNTYIYKIFGIQRCKAVENDNNTGFQISSKIRVRVWHEEVTYALENDTEKAGGGSERRENKIRDISDLTLNQYCPKYSNIQHAIQSFSKMLRREEVDLKPNARSPSVRSSVLCVIPQKILSQTSRGLKARIIVNGK